MAKLSTYELKDVPVVADFVLGTDSETVDLETKNFSIASILTTPTTAINFEPVAVSAQQELDPYKLYVDETSRALSFTLDDPSLPAQRVNREQYARVCNETGQTIPKGSVVYIVDISPTFGVGQVAPAISAHKEQAERVIGVICSDIPTDECGYVLRFSFLLGFDTSNFNAQDVLYLDPHIPGAITNVRPDAPHYPVVIGIASVIGVNGVMGVDVESWRGTDTQVAGGGLFDGMGILRQNISFLVDQGVIYAELYNDQVDTDDYPVMYNGDLYFINTTTGPGTNGAARVALAPGTADSPQLNYIYGYINNGVAEFRASTTFPYQAAIILGRVSVYDSAVTDVDGAFVWQRYNNSISNNGNEGLMNIVVQKLRTLGAKWYSGVTPTLSINGTDIQLTTTSGIIDQLRRQVFDGTTGGEYYVVNDSTLGGGIRKISTLSEITTIEDGTLISNNRLFGLNFFAVQSSEGVTDRIFITLPRDTYGNTQRTQAINDEDNSAVTNIPDGLAADQVTVRICRCVFRYQTTGEWQNVLFEETGQDYQDERGYLLGTASGAGGGGANPITEFTDTEFKIYNATDPTKEMTFDLNALTSGQHKVVALPGSDINEIEIGVKLLHYDADDRVIPESVYPTVIAEFPWNSSRGRVNKFELQATGTGTVDYRVTDSLNNELFAVAGETIQDGIFNILTQPNASATSIKITADVTGSYTLNSIQVY